MIYSLLVFAAGVGLLVGGAWLLIGGGSRVAAVLGVPSVIVGLTVVAFGTSAPELAVSFLGAWRGSTGLVLGNVVGSNVANLGLILAAAALVRPVTVERGLVRRELPLLLVATVVFAVMVLDGELGRVDAALLTAAFGGFILWTVKWSGRAAVVAPPGEMPPVASGHRLRALLGGAAMVLAGVVGLGCGGYLIVGSAVDLAKAVGVSETLIGLTLVAVGTSLPELATTIIAAVRREDDLAVGNIVGSNLFNILAVAGPVGLYRPLVDKDGGLPAQLLSMVLLTALVFVMIVLGKGSVGRRRGAALLMVYVLIMVAWTVVA